MAFDTLVVLAGVYPDLASAEAGYDMVKKLHEKERLTDAMRRADKLERKQLEADVEALERDAKDATAQ